MRRRQGKRTLGFALALLLCVPGLRGAGWIHAATDSPEQDQAPSPAPAAPTPADAVSSFMTRSYKVRPKKLWKRLLETLQSAGYPPEDIDESARRVKTSFVDFDEKNFPKPVAGEPPDFTPDYPILQLIKVKEGKVSLEGVVASSDGGAALSLRARLIVHGLDRRRHLRVMTDRRSSGVIETTIFKRLEDDLGIKPI